ncbi:MAG: hypothetical protein ABIT37_11635 [Luteolibacter sp.]
MKPSLPILLLALSAGFSHAAAPAVGDVSSNRAFALRSGGNFVNKDFDDYEGKILVVMMMTPWCPTCQSNAQAVGDGILDFFSATSRGTLRGKNDKGIAIESILLSTEEAASWDSVNASFSATNGYEQWGLDANASRNNPRTMLGYFRGGFIADTDLHAWGNDRRRLVVLNLVRNSASHSYREIILNQNYFTSDDNSSARSAINAIRPAAAVTVPNITVNPASATVPSGGTATLTLTATGTTPSYQWYFGNTGVTTNPISGATGANYTTPALAATTSYWVRATNSAGSDNSTTATITVTPPPVTAPNITGNPVSATIPSGTTATLTITATGTTPSYQWYFGNTGVTTNPVSGATAATYRTPALTATTSFWVRATNSAGSDNSTTATITVTPPPPVTTTFAQWSAAYSFPSGQSGAADDPDGDGIVNLLESFHGTHPLQPASANVTARLTRDDTGLRLIYQRARNLAGYTVDHQFSSDLIHWTTIPSSNLGITTRDLGTVDEVTVTLPPAGDATGYYHVKVTAS